MVRSRSRRFCASRKGSEHIEKSSLQARKIAAAFLKNTSHWIVVFSLPCEDAVHLIHGKLLSYKRGI